MPESRCKLMQINTNSCKFMSYAILHSVALRTAGWNVSWDYDISVRVTLIKISLLLLFDKVTYMQVDVLTMKFSALPQ